LAVGNTTRFLVSAVTVMLGLSHPGLFVSNLMDQTRSFTPSFAE
jgi:hypothetical protein